MIVSSLGMTGREIMRVRDRKGGAERERGGRNREREKEIEM